MVCGFVWKWNRPWYTPKWKFKWKKHEKTLLKHVTIGYFSHKPTSTHQRVPNQHLEPPYHTLNDPDFGIFGNSIHQDVRSSIQENSLVASRNDYAVTALYPRVPIGSLASQADSQGRTSRCEIGVKWTGQQWFQGRDHRWKGQPWKSNPSPFKNAATYLKKTYGTLNLSIFVGDAIGNNPMFGKALRFDSHLGWAGFHHQMDHFGSSPKFITDQSP